MEENVKSAPSAGEEKCNCKCSSKYNCGGAGGGVYGLAFLGALIYYLQHAQTFMQGVIGFFKALVWPAILIHKLLEFLVK